MDPAVASAARRGVVVAGGLGATLLSHAIASGPVEMLPVAPMLWVTLVALAVLPGFAARAASAFTAWGTPRIVAALAAAQIGFHLLLSAAPWALGVTPHHTLGADLDPRAVAVHLAAALVLTLVIRRGQRWVERAIAVVATLVEAVTPLVRPQRRRASFSTPLPDLHSVVARPGWRGARSSRGPPASPLPAT
ncbi:MAG: hypothetical protein AB7O78_07330 [Thermoleophilia bacterium]